ncbi:hypothetical protein GCM10017608_30930 [Agromyces luteolus]|uniref:Uncharacterized protein n=1 Tax=Agromyces luteolus TaxID=88373 RepID=A0A7C9HIG1_9MICO|nr:hypothetical protein [Agromyces luteolus]MUN07806.1 hypothetical protein [Agromyces luteolus]GLK29157.1 hypothetical protein GCM10017608_30930 [Agromyces luteolus]
MGLPLVALLVPVILTVAWLVSPLGSAAVGLTAAVVVVLAALGVAAYLGYQRTEVAVSPHGIVERGFLGRIHSVARRDMAGVLRIETYRGDTLETVQQLFVVDDDGDCLFRMRGTFWDDRSLDVIAGILDLEETVRTEPVTLTELRESDPHLLYWFEGRGLRA